MSNVMAAGRCAPARGARDRAGRGAEDPLAGRRSGPQDQKNGRSDADHDPADRPSDVLLHELNHRLKNSLQSLLSYLSLRARQTRTRNVKHALHDIRKQVIAIAVLHDEISFSASLETGALLRKIVTHLGSLAATGGRVDLSVQGPSIEIDSQIASPFAMIAAELVWNACKHAFPKRRCGSIVVSVACDGRQMVLIVRDNGVGMTVPAVRGGGTGLAMVRKIAAQHRGRVVIESTPGTGTSVSVALAVPPAQAASRRASRRGPRQECGDLQTKWQTDRQSPV
jgi:two-component sensor histidine kinase